MWSASWSVKRRRPLESYSFVDDSVIDAVLEAAEALGIGPSDTDIESTANRLLARYGLCSTVQRLCSEGVLWSSRGCDISKTSEKNWIRADAV
jgi:hypothetical protein